MRGAAHAASFLATHVRVVKAAPATREDFAASPNVSFFNTGIGLGAIIGGKVIDLAACRSWDSSQLSRLAAR